jgi:hypothetical protein
LLQNLQKNKRDEGAHGNDSKWTGAGQPGTPRTVQLREFKRGDCKAKGAGETGNLGFGHAALCDEQKKSIT